MFTMWCKYILYTCVCICGYNRQCASGVQYVFHKYRRWGQVTWHTMRWFSVVYVEGTVTIEWTVTRMTKLLCTINAQYMPPIRKCTMFVIATHIHWKLLWCKVWWTPKGKCDWTFLWIFTVLPCAPITADHLSWLSIPCRLPASIPLSPTFLSTSTSTSSCLQTQGRFPHSYAQVLNLPTETRFVSFSWEHCLQCLFPECRGGWSLPATSQEEETQGKGPWGLRSQEEAQTQGKEA